MERWEKTEKCFSFHIRHTRRDTLNEMLVGSARIRHELSLTLLL